MRATTRLTKETLIKRYHTLASKQGMNDEERKAFLSAWGAESSKDLTVDQLEHVCRALANSYFEQTADKWRKRVMASIFGWFKLINNKVDAEYVKGVACRASGYDKFNDIPKEKLISIYNTFTHKSKVFAQVGKIEEEEFNNIKHLN
jgi:hypothetical protein